MATPGTEQTHTPPLGGGLVAFLAQAKAVVIDFLKGSWQATLNLLAAGTLLPLTTMMLTFVVAWIVTRLTLFPESKVDVRGYADKLMASETAAAADPSQRAPSPVSDVTNTDDRYMVFLLANIGTMKIVLTWALVVLICVVTWRLFRLIVLAGLGAEAAVDKFQADYFDPAFSFIFDARVYIMTFACIVVCAMVHLLLVLAVFRPSRAESGDGEGGAAGAKPFLNLSLKVTALVFVLGLAFAFALIASGSGEFQSGFN